MRTCSTTAVRPPSSRVSQRTVYYPYYFTKLVNHFGNHDGFAYIIGRVRKTDPKISVPLLRDLIRILTRVRTHRSDALF